MIIKLLFIILIIMLIKFFVIRFDYKDYFNITVSLLLVFFSYLYIMNNNISFFIAIIILSISLILYSFYKQDSNDSSIIFINGNINFRNMIKNNYSLLNLVSDLKKNNMLFINSDICGVLMGEKLIFYSKEDIYNKPVSLIINGKIFYKELLLIGKSKKWIERKVRNNNYLLSDIFYAFYYNNRLYIIKK